MRSSGLSSYGCASDRPEIEGIAAAAAAHDGVDVAVCVPFTLIEAAARVAPGLPIGAQDRHDADWGAHTGCVAAPMLVEAGARTVIVGHSERRGDQNETSQDAWGKAAAAHRQGLDRKSAV